MSLLLAAEEPPRVIRQQFEFRFTGNAVEYFGIWIVNLFLSIITLGIYSAWAKVRKKRYFYGHTWVADCNFEYHGNPVAILKGRIIAVLALGIYSGAGYYSPKLAQVILLLLVILAPWLIVRSMAFNAVNSSYRQIRFHFKAGYQEALRAIWPFTLVVFAAFFMPEIEPEQPRMLDTDEWLLLFAPTVIVLCIYPYVMGAIKRLHISHSAYGAAAMTFSASIGDFYRVYITAWCIAAAGILVLGLTIFFLVLIPIVGWLAIPFVYILFGAMFMGYLRAQITNLTFNSTVLAGRVKFISSLSARRLGKLYFVNLLAITASFGLLIPWAVVRVARYRAQALMLESTVDFDGFVSQIGQQVSATGEEMGEFFDVDLSL